MAWVWRSECNWQELSLPSHSVALRDWTLVLWLGSRPFRHWGPARSYLSPTSTDVHKRSHQFLIVFLFDSVTLKTSGKCKHCPFTGYSSVNHTSQRVRLVTFLECLSHVSFWKPSKRKLNYERYMGGGGAHTCAWPFQNFTLNPCFEIRLLVHGTLKLLILQISKRDFESKVTNFSALNHFTMLTNKNKLNPGHRWSHELSLYCSHEEFPRTSGNTSHTYLLLDSF